MRAWRVPGVKLFFIILIPAVICSCNKQATKKVQVVTADSQALLKKLPGQVISGENEEDTSPQETQDSDNNIAQLIAQVKDIRVIRVKAGESLQLYSAWSGVPAEELRMLNGDKLPVFGKEYKLNLTVSEFNDFQRKRQRYWEERIRSIYDTKIIKPIKYIVKKNDTLSGIAKKFNIPLWFLAAHNEAVDPFHLIPGTKLIIPKIVGEKKKEENIGTNETFQGVGDEFRQEVSVIVEPGETLSLYAKWAGISIEDIKRCNRNLKSIHSIRVGQTIKLPLTPSQLRKFIKAKQEFRKKRKEREKSRKAAVRP